MRQMLLAGWIAFVVLVSAASPAHFWLDSGELSAAGYELGVMHPPGTPGLGLWLRLAAAIPVGTLGFRGAALSSACGAIAVALVFALLRRRGAPAWIAWGASAWVLAGWTFVRQGRVVEIYAMGTVLLLLTLWGFDPSPACDSSSRVRISTPARRLIGVFAAVWAAWAFGDLRLALVPTVFLGWVWAAARRQSWTAWAPLVVVMASAVALGLPLASAREPVHDWGDPQDWSRWLDHVLARSIRTAFATEIWPESWAMWRLNAAAFAAQIRQDLGPLGGLACAVGWLAVLRHGWRNAAGQGTAWALAWLFAVETVYAVGINPMGIADRQTGMVMAPLAALAVAEGVRVSLRERPRVRGAVGALVGVILIVPAAWISGPDARQTRSWAPHAWTRQALSQLPVGTLLLVQSDDLAAGVAAAQTLEGARPDVLVLVAQHLHRLPPTWPSRDARRLPVWESVRQARGETAKIEAALAAYLGPIACEHPGTGIFAPVSFWTSQGEVPIRIQDPHGRVPASPPVERTLATWLPRLIGDVDRERLATALANEARGQYRFERNLAGARATLEAVVEHVRPRHASAWVALAALRDREGQTAAAIQMTRHALALDPGRAAALTNLALYLSRDPDTFGEALELTHRAIALRPHEPSGWLRLAQLRAQAGDAEGARKAQQRASALGSP